MPVSRAEKKTELAGTIEGLDAINGPIPT